MADDVTAKAGKQWDKLESIFEERTAKAMKKLGVPSAKDVQALMDRVDALSAQVAIEARTGGEEDRRQGAGEKGRRQARATQDGRVRSRRTRTRGRRGVPFCLGRAQCVNWPGKNQSRPAVMHEVASELADRHVDDARPERQLEPAGDGAERIADDRQPREQARLRAEALAATPARGRSRCLCVMCS